MLSAPVLRPTRLQIPFHIFTRTIVNPFTKSWERLRDHEAIQTYNKMLRQPVGDTTYPAYELKKARMIFAKIREYRKRSEEGFKPSKLFMVWRIATLVGCPQWEKQFMMELGIAGKDKIEYAIVKNTPSMNKKLWDVKHLIRIQPITFPNGFPKDDDYTGTFLKQTGELVISPKLKVDSELMTKDAEVKGKELEHALLKEDLRLKWDACYPKMY